MMDVLVIGKSGQLAASLLEAERPPGIRMTASEPPELDLADEASIQRAFDSAKPDLVVNAAAYTAVDRAESEPDLAYAINAAGPGVIAALCQNNRIPLIHISTDYVFDGTATRPYRETDPAKPLGIYGLSKYEGERRISAICERHLIFRTSWLYSPFGHNFVKTMIRLGAERDELRIVSDQIGNPTYAPHLADAILKVMVRLKNDKISDDIWGLYHASAMGEASWHDFACEVFNQIESSGGVAPKVTPITTQDYPTPARRPANSRLDCSKLKNTFDVHFPNWRDGVRECIARLGE